MIRHRKLKRTTSGKSAAFLYGLLLGVSCFIIIGKYSVLLLGRLFDYCVNIHKNVEENYKVLNKQVSQRLLCTVTLLA